METSMQHPRILIGASSFADAAAALNILRLLKPGGSLGGLLVEEHETIAQCKSLKKRIITPGGATMRAPSIAQLKTLMDAEAKAFRSTLAKVSEPLGAQWSFERSKGELVQISLQASSGWDIVVLGHRKIHPCSGRIILLESLGTGNQMLSDFADKLVDGTTAAQIVFSVGQPSRKSSGGKSFETIQDVLPALARTNAQAVLLDLSKGPIRSAAELKQLLDVARCPVFFFGAAKSGKKSGRGAQIPKTPGADGEAHHD